MAAVIPWCWDLAMEAVEDEGAMAVLIDALLEDGEIEAPVDCLQAAGRKEGLCLSCGRTRQGEPYACSIWRQCTPGNRKTMACMSERERAFVVHQAQRWIWRQMAGEFEPGLWPWPTVRKCLNAFGLMRLRRWQDPYMRAAP